MWTRVEIKNYAKEFLRKHYWKAFVVCLIASLISGDGNTGSSNDEDDAFYNDNTYITNNYYINEQSDDYYVREGFQDEIIFEEEENIEVFDSFLNMVENNLRSPIFILFGGLSTLLIVILIILKILVSYALEVGKTRFFLDGFKEDVSIGKLFSTFNFKEYLPILKTMFLRDLYVILWSFLFIIPGIIKAYEYQFVPYILAEKPDLTPNEVITRSREITNGHKMDMFILDLSFLGWYFLGTLLFGVGIFFVYPYVEASYARLYNILSEDDIDSSYEEVVEVFE